MLLGRNYDVAPKLFTDFPRSRNFDILIIGGSKAYQEYGNYAYYGDGDDKRKILSLCYPYRTSEINFEILRMYHSYLKKGGQVILHQDLTEDELVGKKKHFRNTRILHKIQRITLGSEYSKFDYVRNIFHNHKLSWFARKHAHAIQLPPTDLPTMLSSSEVADFCKKRGYELA